jgi:hypothetical protein
MFRLNSARSKAEIISDKLQFILSNPMTIVKFVGPNVILLANPETGVIVRPAYVRQLKAFKN